MERGRVGDALLALDGELRSLHGGVRLRASRTHGLHRIRAASRARAFQGGLHRPGRVGELRAGARRLRTDESHRSQVGAAAVTDHRARASGRIACDRRDGHGRRRPHWERIGRGRGRRPGRLGRCPVRRGILGYPLFGRQPPCDVVSRRKDDPHPERQLPHVALRRAEDLGPGCGEPRAAALDPWGEQ